MGKELTHIGTIIIFLSAFVFVEFGCYTQLNRQNSTEKLLPISKRPDLAITDITRSVFHEIIMDDPNPLPATEFYIHVRNVGAGYFSGSLMFNYADNWRDIDNNVLPNVGGIGSYKIPSGDSIVVTIKRQHCLYPSGAPFRFALRTDDYPPHTFDPVYYFGREPIPEVSLENNVADFIMP